MKVVVTGAAGNIGRAVCAALVDEAHEVVGVDNSSRAALFGVPGASDVVAGPGRAHTWIARDFAGPEALAVAVTADAVVHCAAQTSHPRSIEIPVQDFEVNAVGAIRLLDAIRRADKPPVLVLVSTSKVYGDHPDTRCGVVTRGRRYDYADPNFAGVDEQCPLGDQTCLTPFGVSKMTADLMAQEYARHYGLTVGVLRPNCVASAGQRGFEQQGWLAYTAARAARGEPVTVYGHGGMQVRDVLHARDFAVAVVRWLRAPRNGVWNVGGGRTNTLSMNEWLDRLTHRFGPIARVDGPRRPGDWKIYATDSGRFQRDFEWAPVCPLGALLDEMEDRAAFEVRAA